jgi:hypothetical protein
MQLNETVIDQSVSQPQIIRTTTARQLFQALTTGKIQRPKKAYEISSKKYRTMHIIFCATNVGLKHVTPTSLLESLPPM